MRDIEKMKQNKPLIIFDTDMDTDCDDAGALAMLYEYVKRDKAELLGIVTDVVSPYAAACCEALGAYYGVERPIGTVYASEYPEQETNRLSAYRKHSLRVGDRRYNCMMADRVKKRDTDYLSAVSVYRRLLADAPDHSVTVVCVGLLTALDALLQSAGDEISPLSGRELLSSKVTTLVSMGYPDHDGSNFNWDMDSEAAQRFLSDCPVPMVISGAGGNVITGTALSTTFPANHPLRQIYETFNRGAGRGRASWDLIATLYALEPDTLFLTAVERGTCCYDPEHARSYWQADGKRRDRDLVMTHSPEATAAALDARMMGDF